MKTEQPGASAFTELSDVPKSYSTFGSNVVAVKASQNGLEFIPGGAGGTGNVVGPVSSADNNVALFSGITGKIIKDSGITITGSNTGDNSTNTQYSGLVSNVTHTGDAAGATVLTLATVNATVGSFTNANVTVNAKGLVTSVANGTAGSGPTKSFVIAMSVALK